MSGKRYPEEFKIEAVKQVIDRGHSVSSVAKEFAIVLEVITQAFTELDNKTTHGQSSVLDRHTPFFLTHL